MQFPQKITELGSNSEIEESEKSKKIDELKTEQYRALDSLKLCREFQEVELDLTNLPYGKGQLFFMMLENALGRKNFDPFLKHYIRTHALDSMNKERFLFFLKLWLQNNLAGMDFDDFMQNHKVDWN